MEDYLQQLLEIELSLKAAHSSMNISNTDLLISHINELSQHENFNKIYDNEECLSIEEIEVLLKSSKPTNLSDYCHQCNQSFYENDKDASIGKHKANLQKCCLNSLEFKYNDLEIFYWWFFIKNFENCISILPNYTRLMMNHGIPANLRSLVWGLLSLSINSKNKILNEKILKNLYKNLNIDISEDIKIISNDVNRTFPQLSTLSNDENKCKFEKILNAFSVYNFDIGYCQGIQFIVAPLLFHFEDEIKTFNSLINLFEINPFLKKIYNSEMTNLNIFFYKFENLFKKFQPELYAHFNELGLDIKVFLSQWFLSFYSVTMPFQFSIRMFDILLFEGIETTLLRSGLVILQKNENLLLQIDDSELIYQHLLSENCWGVFNNNCDLFISNLLELNIQEFKNSSLKSLEINYMERSSIPRLSKSFNKFFNGLSSKFPTSSNSSISDSDNESISSTLFSMKNSSTLTINTEKSKSDLDLVKQMYDLCLSNGLNDPLLEKVKQRIVK